MPEWNPKANDIFVRAAEIDAPTDRRLFLEQQCGGDAALKSQVESLLAAGGKIGSFLEKPAVPAPPPGDTTGAYRPLTEGPGTVIGPYKLLQHIGEGGFGAVYMAEQEHPVRRKVALKIIKLGMDTREVIARFESERQALAMMEHPNIARVFDAGATESGRPYFVMELVRGVPITEFCDKNRFSAEQRLKLFVAVCNAIQHAHHKGIIHRDIKPSNVMVTLHDGVPVVKVIDFGVAKATAQKLTERTLFTAYGQMIGTPAYMSPEQAEMSGLDIDMRSDIFSLGVLLYELLTGTTPLDSASLRKAGYAEMQRLIREEEAPRPSTRFSSMGGEATVLATNRGTDVKRLSQLLRSDLDWIVMKSLDKDRNRRYGSPATFAADVERYLKDEAVEACPPTLGYRLRKTYRRNRAAVLVGGAFATLLTVGVVAASLLAIRATNSERQATADRDAAVAAETTAEREKVNALSARDELRHALYASDLQMAASMWQGNDLGRTLEMLDRHRPRAGEPDIRGFEWHYLNRESRTADRTLALAEGGKAFTPDGRRIYVVPQADQRKDERTGSTYRSWDLHTGKELPEWEPFPGKELSLLSIPRFSQTGSRALVTYRIGAPERGQERDYNYKVFDMEARKELFTLNVRSGLQLHTLLDREGRLLAVHYDDENFRPEPSVTIWNVDEQKVARVISVDSTKGEMFGSRGRAFHPNGKHYAAVVTTVQESGRSSFCELHVWDVHTGAEAWRLPVEGGNSLGSLVYSPDGKYLAEMSAESDVITLRNSEGGEVLHKCRIPSLGSRSSQKYLSFSPDGTRFGVSLFDQSGIHVWDIPTLPSVAELLPIRSIPTDSHFTQVGFTADGRSVVVTRTRTTNAHYYNFASREVALSGPDAIRSPFSSSPASIRRPVAVSGVSANHGLAWAIWKVESPGSPKAEVRAWDATGRVVFQVQFDSLEGRYSGIMTRDGKRLILIQTSRHQTDPTQDRSRVLVWDIQKREEVFAKDIAEGWVTVWGIHPDGRTLAISRLRQSRSPKGRVEDLGTRLSLWDLHTNQEIHGEEIDGWVSGADMNQDGSRVAWALSLRDSKNFSKVRVWDTATGREVWARDDWGTRGRFFQPDRLKYSRDGRTLVVASMRTAGEQIYVLDATTGGDQRPPLLNTDGDLANLCLSEDGRRLFALATRLRNTVVVWDLVTGRKLLSLPVNNVSEMTTDREGRRIYLMKDVPGTGKLELETFDGTPLADEK